MDTFVEVGMTRARALTELRAALQKIEATPEGETFEVTLYGQSNNLDEGETNITFSNEDMEGRPYVAESTFVDITTQ